MQDQRCCVVVLISGDGKNLQALIDASSHSGYMISHVISNNPEAFGLERAKRCGISSTILNHKDFGTREGFDNALLQAINRKKPDLVVLAGFMRILGPEIVNNFTGRMLNIHPSLLPKHPGTNTHQRALDAGDHEHGASVHFVTEKLDGGPLIAQERIPINANEAAQELGARVLIREQQLYPKVVSWFASGRLCLQQNQAMMDGVMIPRGGLQFRS
ncbi:MAG: phosphoribosylglycinamide formyltransferase [Gammaproteobacteria bacterium]|nr:phosphoribosylglycinamide formyltransferase [Gammaproteobacteria bacterium]